MNIGHIPNPSVDRSYENLERQSFVELPKRFTSKAGLQVKTADSNWKLIPNKGKGNTVKIDWVHNGKLSDLEINLTLQVYVHYAETKSASTVATVMIGSNPIIADGFPSLADLKAMWSGLPVNRKKATNQFFGALVRLGNREFTEHHRFTKNHLGKSVIDPLDPAKGRLNDFEFNSISKALNLEIAKFNWQPSLMLSYFIEPSVIGRNTFTMARKLVGKKLILGTLRRPLQISMLKWSDLISVGDSFSDDNLPEKNEISDIGITALQIRLFRVKNNKKELQYRAIPERYPMALSEDITCLLYKYKKLYAKGVFFMCENSGLRIDKNKIPFLMQNMPVFPERALFERKFGSFYELETTFTNHSALYHVSEQTLTKAMSDQKGGKSDRTSKLQISSNRLRHTALTRAAEQGLGAAEIARITGVTEPATRHYIDIDYGVRQLIDRNYLANQFLKNAFNVPVERLEEGGEVILSSDFDEIGGVQESHTCNGCSSVMGRPIACYGCPNFKPILEADHQSVLKHAQAKLAVNAKQITGPLKGRSTEKLVQQIEYIKITISICDEILSNKSTLNAERVS